MDNKKRFTEKQRVVVFRTANKTIVKEFTRVTFEDDTYDLYQDTIVIDNATGKEDTVEHISLHRSGCNNVDYVCSFRTTHVHQKKTGETYIYDQDKGSKQKRYYDAQAERE